MSATLSKAIDRVVKTNTGRDGLNPLDDFFVPRRIAFDESVKRLDSSIETLRPGVDFRATKFSSLLEQASGELRMFEGQSLECFEVERVAFRNKIAKIRKAISRLERLILKNKSIIDKRSAKISKVNKDNEQDQKRYGEVLEAFPQAQIIDLACLSYFRKPNGFPKLTLFSTRNDLTHLEIGRTRVKICEGDYSKYSSGTALRLPLGSIQEDQFAKGILAACGISNEKMTRHDKVILLSQFGDGKAVIPSEARATIKRALNSNLFADVLLLAEVDNWRVAYDVDAVRNSIVTPKIKGKVVPLPPPRVRYDPNDPIIVGIMDFNKTLVAVSIGAFDVTLTESLAQSEFSSSIGTIKNRRTT